MKMLSIIIAFVLIAGIMIFQATRSSASTVKTPREVVALGEGASLARVRVAGRVADVPIEFQLQPTLLLSFTITDPPARLDHTKSESEQAQVAAAAALPGATVALVRVQYAGERPNMFNPGRDVILDGELKNGVLYADKLLTQCPSKYQAPDPQKQYGSAEQSTTP